MEDGSTQRSLAAGARATWWGMQQQPMRGVMSASAVTLVRHASLTLTSLFMR